MKGRSVALAVLLALAAATLLMGPAAAQQGNQTAQDGNETVAASDYETIDKQTAIVRSSYDPIDQTATLTLHSETLQQVTVTDVSPYMDGGVMEQRSVTLRPGEQTTIEIPVDPSSNGFVGLSIATPSTLYAEPLEKPGVPLGPPKESDLLALLIAPVSLAAAGRTIEWWNSRRRRKGVVRIDG